LPLAKPRYDGLADWYDAWNGPHAARNAAEVLDLLGPGNGLCLDLGCGTGLYFEVLTATGRTVVGIDRSADQLRIAHGRCRQTVQGDAAAAPFADGTFQTVATMWVSTDVDDFTAVLAEAARVLAPSGLLVFYGAHPCFNGPHTQWMEDGGILAHPTYRLAGWHEEAPWWGANIRRRFGMRHHPLADLLNAFIGTGLDIEHVAELGDRPVPVILAIRARKPALAAQSRNARGNQLSRRGDDGQTASVEVIEARRDNQLVDAAAQIWAEATAARDGDDDVPGLDDSRPIILGVLDRSDRALLLIARSADGVAGGFAAVEPVGGTSKVRAQVSYFGVRPGMWGHGIGGWLLRDLQRRLKAEGYTHAELSVYTDNRRATALYQRLGWRPVGQPTAHPRSGKPEQRYELCL
jgi:SAM-dependent methyltransferase/GNAT superfamily N-acetyltransferase